jgi:hypothetical protein
MFQYPVISIEAQAGCNIGTGAEHLLESSKQVLWYVFLASAALLNGSPPHC